MRRISERSDSDSAAQRSFAGSAGADYNGLQRGRDVASCGVPANSVQAHKSPPIHSRELAGTDGNRLGNRCSILLSYGRSQEVNSSFIWGLEARLRLSWQVTSGSRDA